MEAKLHRVPSVDGRCVDIVKEAGPAEPGPPKLWLSTGGRRGYDPERAPSRHFLGGCITFSSLQLLLRLLPARVKHLMAISRWSVGVSANAGSKGKGLSQARSEESAKAQKT